MVRSSCRPEQEPVSGPLRARGMNHIDPKELVSSVHGKNGDRRTENKTEKIPAGRVAKGMSLAFATCPHKLVVES